MEHLTAIIIGAGHAGLAMSRALTQRSIEHVVLDRGQVGHAWRTARWDSLRMLTPNWANGLPGMPLHGVDPDGFMRASEFADKLCTYARAVAVPLCSGVTVKRLTSMCGHYRVETDAGSLSAEVVINATGAATLPRVPVLSQEVPRHILQITPDRYRRPSDLPLGDVLIVGASASGVQLARELQGSGRQVTLAVGGHVRLPRRYRGRDIEHWLDACGILDERAEQIDDLTRARHTPSPQLSGAGPVDLNALQSLGVEVTGRVSAIRGGKALFSGGLAHLTTLADLKMNRTLERIDALAGTAPEPDTGAPPERPEPTVLRTPPRLSRDLGGTLRTIVWATGHRPDHAWIDLPVLDARGRLRHEGGICPLPGLYLLGLPVLRRRRSHHISGAAADTQDLAFLIARHLDAMRAA
ncbi:MAG: NAD(P)-binding domain-containing protein [Pseudomonadota bacterium]